MNATERSLRLALSDIGIPYRTTETVAGSLPALTIPQCLMVVFISRCYEDRCPRHYSKRTAKKSASKLAQFDRDREKEGWLVVRFWEHEIEEDPHLVAGRIALIYRAMRQAMGYDDEG